MHQKSLIQFSVNGCSCVPSLLFTWGQTIVEVVKIMATSAGVLVHTRFCLCPTRVCFPVLCKVSRLYDGVNGDLLQEDLCHIQLCCTQSPCPCVSSLLIHTSTGDTQTQFCLGLCGVSGSWCTQDLFEPSECFCWVWGLILNVISPLLPSCWVFSSWMWGISSHFLQHHATWKRSILIPIPKTRNVKECSNYYTIVLISQASKVMLKILQDRLQ